MAGDHGLSNLRFVGYDNPALVEQVDGLRNGAGPGTLNDAVLALVKLADGLADTDEALRRQLSEIGVSWQGEAAAGGTSATENASIYAEQSQGPVTDSAKGVDFQGAAFSTTKNSAPDSGTLNGPTEENGIDQFMGFFGHTTDHAQEVKDTNAARQQAIDAMNNYQSNSIDALGRSQALPVPPGMNLNAQPVDTSTHTSSVAGFVGNGGGGFTPGVGPGGGGGSTAFVPGSGPGAGPLPTVGGNPPVTGAPPLTGGGPFPGGPSLPSGVSPLAPALRAVNPLLMADAATAIGAGGASGAGAGADGERLARSGGQRGPAKNPVPLGSAPEEEARAARNAERFGARSGKPGSSIMQPAAAGRNQDGEEDQEHIRRYGVESSDVFDDDRVVAPESIGDDDEQ
ncbi:PPE domain-containing protein [Actinophytocola oryzae]|uniref:PPE family protein n=1 Tax=Actinophytocola oryzae TaxID=502181 RepID=A0A4V3FTB3_9PSEU|nr:PPE domain-containing protein [Actinophytocola oryzae]TDV50671.1 PPE family protein [Actinophytocola oryzae]